MADRVATAPPAHSIGELRERSLHAALKRWYALPGDRAEVPLQGYVIDLVRHGTLIEIQTGSFAKLARKLTRLVRDHRIRLVFPIARRKWIVTTGPDGSVLRRRASPKRGAYRDLFAELVRIPLLIGNPNFTLEVLIQTGSFAKLARKLTRLVRDHRIRLVFPIARRKWIVTTGPDGSVLRRRASPKRGAYRDLFAELVRIPLLIGNPNFTLEVLIVEVEELRCADGHGSWRRRGISILDTRLLEVCDRRTFRTPADCARLLPPHLEEPFTNRALAAADAMPVSLAGMMTYTLRRMGAIELVGGRAGDAGAAGARTGAAAEAARRNRAHLFART